MREKASNTKTSIFNIMQTEKTKQIREWSENSYVKESSINSRLRKRVTMRIKMSIDLAMNDKSMYMEKHFFATFYDGKLLTYFTGTKSSNK